MSGKKITKIYSKEEINQAKQVDIVDFINTHGKGTLTGSRRYMKYHINGHDSLVIDRKKNYFYHNGQSRGDNIITLLTDYEGYTFGQAVGLLLGEELEQHTPFEESDEPEEAFKYQYEKDTSITQARNYLVEKRGLDQQIVDYLIDNNYLIQDKKFKSAVLNWKEFGIPDGDIVGATSITTSNQQGSSSKYIMKTSKRHYGFNITLGQPKKLYFFEAAIDMLSYWSMNKNLEDARLVCLEGLKDRTVLQFIEETYREFETLPSEGIFYAVDNDHAGHRFFDRMNRDINIRKAMDSEEVVENSLLNPYNYQVEQSVYEAYQRVAAAKQIDPQLLLAVGKMENNLSQSEQLSNGFNVYGYFSKNDKEANPKATIDLTASLEKLAEAIQEKNITLDTTDVLYEELLSSEMDKQSLRSTIKDYYHHTFEVVDKVGKDWNDELLLHKAQGFISEKQPLSLEKNPRDYISTEKITSFSYYLQDAEDWTQAKQRLTSNYHIDPMLVQALMKKGLIRQDDNQRIVYLWAKNGKVLGGQITGTIESKTFGREKVEKGILELSKEGYGFNFTLGKQPKDIYFFQSPEDLLAYWSLNKDTLKDVTLFSLSDNSPESLIKILNERMEEGATYDKVHIGINHNKFGAELIDGVALLDAFDRQEKSLITSFGKKLPITSERPTFARTWQEENVAKKERVARLHEYQAFLPSQHAKEKQPSVVMEQSR